MQLQIYVRYIRRKYYQYVFPLAEVNIDIEIRKPTSCKDFPAASF